MYFYGSTLRTPDMDLYEMTGVLEVSETKIAEATGIAQTTVRNYIDGEVKNPDQDRLDKIYRYLNSREYYRGYIFMRWNKFIKFLKEVIDVLKNKYTESYMAKRMGMTKDRLSKIKSGTIGDIDIFEQYHILKTLYDMCYDENDHVEDDYIPICNKLKEVLALSYPESVTAEFSKILDIVVFKCRWCKDKSSDRYHYVRLEEVIEVLDKYGLGGEIERLRKDENFIMDNDVRCNIISDLRPLYDQDLSYCVTDEDGTGPFYDPDTGPLDMDLDPPPELDCAASSIDIMQSSPLDEEFRIIKEYICHYSGLLRAVIFDNIFAFIEEVNGNFWGGDVYVNSETGETYEYEHQRKEFYNIDEPIFVYKSDIMKEFRKLSLKNKREVCAELIQELKQYRGSKNIKALPFPLRFWHYSDGLILYDEATGWYSTLSSIAHLAMITERTRTLRQLDSMELGLPYRISQLCKEHIEISLWLCTKSEINTILQKLDEKLDYGSIDWSFYGLLSQAVCIYAPLEHIVSYIRSLNRKDIEQER